MLSRWPCAVIAGWVCTAAPAWAQQGRIDTDGPDFVESTESVARGRVQFEAGTLLEQERRNGARIATRSTPLLLKAGLGAGVEARLETVGAVRMTGEDAAGAPAHLSGSADTALGLKWHVRDRDANAGAPALAWIAHLEAPSGSGALRGQGWRPSLRAVIGWDLPHEASIGLMPGLRWDARGDGRRYLAGIFGAVAGLKLTPRWRVFGELQAAQIAHARDGGVLLYQNLGAAYMLADDWQIGMRAGWAANRNTPTRYALLALAGRF